VLTLDQELLDGIRQIVREEISGVKDDVSSLKNDVSSLKTDVSGLKDDVSSLKTDVSILKKDVAEMKPQLEENTNIVRALLANSEEHSAKLDQLEHRVSNLEGSQKRQGELEAYLKNHHHQIVIETGEPVFDE
jgi:chromosome segregation ATPase